MVSALSLETSDGFTIFVENRRLSISLYTFLEQETWFEPEAEFVRLFLQPGMRVVDIGANCGFYTLLAAAKVGAHGRVWAFEPGRAASRLLQESLQGNRFTNATLHKAAMGNARGQVWFADAADNELSKVMPEGSAGGRYVAMESLDALHAEGHMTHIDFIKIDAEEHEGEVIAGGAAFFARESPVVMIEVSESHGPSQMLAAMGYARYRFSNALGCLVPYEGDRPGEKNFNIFLCKPDRADRLHQSGLLVTPAELAAPLPEAEPAVFLQAFRGLAIVKSYPELLALADAPQTGQVLAWYGAMAELLMSEDRGLPIAERAIRLNRAEAFVDGAFNDRSTLPELLGYCRIWRSTGRSLMASTALKLVIENASHPQFSSLGLPFMPVLPEWDGKSAGPGGFAPWLQAMMQTSLEVVHAFSSAFDGANTIRAYSIARTAGLAEDWLERGAVLKAMLVGADPVPSPLFIGGDVKRNRAIWRQIAAHAAAGCRDFPELPQTMELG